ncbi:MAG: SulP family inorganic anion transporter [Verrucomicrobiota bacterium]|nr:SulP family inorganic anion transporter [Verrucomicrobiota bacterium]
MQPVFLMRPQLLASLQGYDRAALGRDVPAGFTVGIVALPLAIGFGIASGVTPGPGPLDRDHRRISDSGAGGSKVQIGGPTGAFVPTLAAIVAAYGSDGLALATMIAGLMLALTVVFDLTVAVGLGLLMAPPLFIRQMEAITHVRLVTPESEMDLGGDSLRHKDVPAGVLVYRIDGPFFTSRGSSI